MLERRLTPVGDTVEVTFVLPSMAGAEFVHLVGDFNGWSRESTPMQMTADGFLVTLELRAGATYQFRYLLDGQRWENDWAADEYVGNEFGGENSVLDLSREVSSDGPALQPPAVGGEPRVDALQVDAAHPLMDDAASSLLETASAGGGPSSSEPEPEDASKGETATPKERTGKAATRKGSTGKGSTGKESTGKESTDEAKPEDKKAKSKGPAKGPAKSSVKGSKGSERSKGGKSAKSGGSPSRKSAKRSNGDGVTKAELLEAARELDISGRSTMKKDELAKAVAAARRA